MTDHDTRYIEVEIRTKKGKRHLQGYINWLIRITAKLRAIVRPQGPRYPDQICRESAEDVGGRWLPEVPYHCQPKCTESSDEVSTTTFTSSRLKQSLPHRLQIQMTAYFDGEVTFDTRYIWKSAQVYLPTKTEVRDVFLLVIHNKCSRRNPKRRSEPYCSGTTYSFSRPSGTALSEKCSVRVRKAIVMMGWRRESLNFQLMSS